MDAADSRTSVLMQSLCTCPLKTDAQGVVVRAATDVFCKLHGSMSREMVPCKACLGKGSVPKEKQGE